MRSHPRRPAHLQWAGRRSKHKCLKTHSQDLGTARVREEICPVGLPFALGDRGLQLAPKGVWWTSASLCRTHAEGASPSQRSRPTARRHYTEGRTPVPARVPQCGPIIPAHKRSALPLQRKAPPLVGFCSSAQPDATHEGSLLQMWIGECGHPLPNRCLPEGRAKDGNSEFCTR